MNDLTAIRQRASLWMDGRVDWNLDRLGIEETLRKVGSDYRPGDCNMSHHFWKRWPVFLWAFDSCWAD